jgi:hypothetical protein
VFEESGPEHNGEAKVGARGVTAINCVSLDQAMGGPRPRRYRTRGPADADGLAVSTAMSPMNSAAGLAAAGGTVVLLAEGPRADADATDSASQEVAVKHAGARRARGRSLVAERSFA